MKKTFAIMLALCLCVFLLVACREADDDHVAPGAVTSDTDGETTLLSDDTDTSDTALETTETENDTDGEDDGDTKEPSQTLGGLQELVPT